MHNNFNKLSFGIAVCLIAGVASAGAVIGATEPTQILNLVELTASYAEQAQQTVTQINQYETMLRNLTNSTPSSLLGQAAGSLWTDQNMTQTFKNLQTIVLAGQRMDYTLQNQDQMFKTLHPGYGSAFDFKNGYKNLSDNTLGSVQNALAAAGAQSQKFSTEQAMMQELQTRSQSADGQMKVLQAGNDIGIAMVGQMQQMRQLSIAQMTEQSHYMAAQQDLSNNSHQVMQDYLTGHQRTHVRTLEEIANGVQ